MTQRPIPLRAPPTAAPSRAAVELRARRGLPRLPRGYVEPRAVQRLGARPLPPMLVLQTPRGFGKTATASWLLRQDDDPHHDHVWVNLPPEHVTAAQLWETVRRRLRDAGLEDGDWAGLDRSLARRRRRLVLAIDDLDRVETAADDELAALVTHHEQIHLVLMTRRRRPVQLAATMLDGVVLRVAELGLAPGEVVRMAARLGHDLDPEAAADLATRLGGWPALLRLALADPLRDGDGRVVVEQSVIDRYVRLRVEDIADPEIRQALTVLAVAEQPTVELAHRLVGRPLFDAVVDQLADEGATAAGDLRALVLAAPIRTAVASVLAEDDPARFREVNLRTSRWFAAHGQPAASLRHALDAQAWEVAGELLTQHWSALLADHADLVRRAIDLLPAEVVDGDARLLVARDYILNVFAEGRARAAYEAGLLVPDGVARARSGRRLSLRQVLSLRSTGLYDVAHTLVESRDIAAAVEESGWPADVVARIPTLLLDWARSFLLGNPGVAATYAFCEAAGWAEHVGAVDVRREAAAGAALSHVVIGYPVAAQEWLDLLAALPPAGAADARAVAMETLARALVAQQTLTSVRPPAGIDALVIPDELADLQVLRLKLHATALLADGRCREATRLLESYRVRPPEDGTISLVEHVLVGATVESYLSVSQVERARRLLLEVDPGTTRHPITWAMVDFQSGEFERVDEAIGSIDAMVPRQTLEAALLRACAALRRQQQAAAIDAFQSAVSTAMQTGMRRPFLLVPGADLAELSADDEQVAELLEPVVSLRPLLAEPQDGSGLSPRELQVLEVVATGASFAAVASRLFVSPNTVKSQMRDIYRKLGVRGREHAVERARELGLLRR